MSKKYSFCFSEIMVFTLFFYRFDVGSGAPSVGATDIWGGIRAREYHSRRYKNTTRNNEKKRCNIRQ